MGRHGKTESSTENRTKFLSLHVFLTETELMLVTSQLDSAFGLHPVCILSVSDLYPICIPSASHVTTAAQILALTDRLSVEEIIRLSDSPLTRTTLSSADFLDEGVTVGRSFGPMVGRFLCNLFFQMLKLNGFLYENHWGGPHCWMCRVLLNMLNGIIVLNMP